MTNAPDLKSCPCCGAIPTVKLGAPGCAWVKCECGMETTDGSVSRVIAIWNTRAADIHAARVAEFEEALISAKGCLEWVHVLLPVNSKANAMAVVVVKNAEDALNRKNTE